jgi:predicted cobalt transporter CbtA
MGEGRSCDQLISQVATPAKSAGVGYTSQQELGSQPGSPAFVNQVHQPVRAVNRLVRVQNLMWRLHTHKTQCRQGFHAWFQKGYFVATLSVAVGLLPQLATCHATVLGSLRWEVSGNLKRVSGRLQQVLCLLNKHYTMAGPYTNKHK